jgi:hypothetical protein
MVFGRKWFRGRAILAFPDGSFISRMLETNEQYTGGACSKFRAGRNPAFFDEPVA